MVENFHQLVRQDQESKNLDNINFQEKHKNNSKFFEKKSSHICRSLSKFLRLTIENGCCPISKK